MTSAAQKDLAYKRSVDQSASYANQFNASLQGVQSQARMMAEMMDNLSTTDRGAVSPPPFLL